MLMSLLFSYILLSSLPVKSRGCTAHHRKTSNKQAHSENAMIHIIVCFVPIDILFECLVDIFPRNISVMNNNGVHSLILILSLSFSSLLLVYCSLTKTHIQNAVKFSLIIYNSSEDMIRVLFTEIVLKVIRLLRVMLCLLKPLCLCDSCSSREFVS